MELRERLEQKMQGIGDVVVDGISDNSERVALRFNFDITSREGITLRFNFDGQPVEVEVVIDDIERHNAETVRGLRVGVATEAYVSPYFTWFTGRATYRAEGDWSFNDDEPDDGETIAGR